MIDLQPAPVPELSEEWIASHRAALVEALTQWRRRPTKWVGLAGATVVAATVSTLVLVGGSEQYAFAGWSASPTTPVDGQLRAADTVCQARLAQAAQLAPSNKGPYAGGSLVPELSDVRGPYTVTVFGNGAQNRALCISTPDSTSLRWIMGTGAPVGAGAIAVDQMSVLARDGKPYTLVEGRTGDRVTGVTLALVNGARVTTTSGYGLFVAWWPGSENVTSATVSTVSGASTQDLNLPGLRIPTPPGFKSTPTAVGTPSS